MTGANAMTLSPELVQMARLESGESVEWVGKPEVKGIVPWKKYYLWTMVGNLVMLISSYKSIMTLMADPSNLLAWFVVVLVLTFPWLVIVLIGKSQEMTAADTVYVITSKRALIFVGPRMQEFKAAFYLDTIERDDGFKDLVLDRSSISQANQRIGFLSLSGQDAEIAQPLLVAALAPPLVRKLNPQQELKIIKNGPA